MKKILAMILAALMILSMAACAAKTQQNEPAEQAPAAETAEEAQPAAEQSAEASDFETVSAKGTVVVGITDFAPMDYRDENGEWTGFDAELAREVFGKMGFANVEFTEIDWDNKIFELDSGSIDCVWNGMTLNDEVMKAMECTKPYVLNAQVVVMDSANITDDMTDETIAELNFAVEAGSAGAMTAADFGYENVTEVQAQANALMEVAAGTSDACIIDLTMANAMTGEGTSYENLAIAVELTNEEYGIGFRKGSDMAAMVNDTLDAMKADGSLQELADQYGLSLVNG